MSGRKRVAIAFSSAQPNAASINATMFARTTYLELFAHKIVAHLIEIMVRVTIDDLAF